MQCGEYYARCDWSLPMIYLSTDMDDDTGNQAIDGNDRKTGEKRGKNQPAPRIGNQATYSDGRVAHNGCHLITYPG